MGLCSTWDIFYLQYQRKEQYSVMLIYQYPVTNLRNCLENNKCINDDSQNHKNGTLDMTFHKPAGGENLYVRFEYIQLKIC